MAGRGRAREQRRRKARELFNRDTLGAFSKTCAGTLGLVGTSTVSFGERRETVRRSESQTGEEQGAQRGATAEGRRVWREGAHRSRGWCHCGRVLFHVPFRPEAERRTSDRSMEAPEQRMHPRGCTATPWCPQR